MLDSFEAIQAVRELFHVSTVRPSSSSSAASAAGSAQPQLEEELSPAIASPLLRRVLHEAFPNLRELLAFFTRSFDKKDAKEHSKITPARGTDPAYDATLAAVAGVEGESLEISTHWGS